MCTSSDPVVLPKAGNGKDAWNAPTYRLLFTCPTAAISFCLKLFGESSTVFCSTLSMIATISAFYDVNELCFSTKKSYPSGIKNNMIPYFVRKRNFPEIIKKK